MDRVIGPWICVREFFKSFKILYQLCSIRQKIVGWILRRFIFSFRAGRKANFQCSWRFINWNNNLRKRIVDPMLRGDSMILTFLS